MNYDSENRPIDFYRINSTGGTTVHCEYDYMGRRTTKMVTVGNNVTLQQRYIYRGYLQIACIDLTRSHHPALWFITWDPTQPVATRPLALQKDGIWYTYGWDLTKNICELYSPSGYIRTAYTYAPYGQATSTGDVDQPIQWSSEFNDTELGLVYYNYRHYNPEDGRWIGRDLIIITNLYKMASNCPLLKNDVLGLDDEYYLDELDFEQEHCYVLYFTDIERHKNIKGIIVDGLIKNGAEKILKRWLKKVLKKTVSTKILAFEQMLNEKEQLPYLYAALHCTCKCKPIAYISLYKYSPTTLYIRKDEIEREMVYFEEILKDKINLHTKCK